MKISIKSRLLIISMVLIYTACSNSDIVESIEDPFEGLPVLDIGEPLDFNDDNLGGPDDFFFSSNYFHHMSFDSKGDFFVVNRGDVSIFHFNEQGELLARIGARGEGPGEFQVTPKFDLLNEDTLVTLDARSWMVTYFVYQDGEWSYDNSLLLERKDHVQPDKIIRIDSERIAVLYLPFGFSLVQGAIPFDYETTVDLMSVTGELLRENWISVPSQQYSVFSSESEGTRMTPLPMGPNSYIDSGPQNRLYHVWSNEFIIKIHNPDGVIIDSLQHDSYRMELSEERRRTIVNDIVSIPMGATSYYRNVQEKLFEDMPLEAPVLQDMHVDRDTGEIIVRCYRFDDSPNWMLMDANGERIGVFTLDDDMNVFDFRRGRIIGSITDENDMPTVRIVTLPE